MERIGPPPLLVLVTGPPGAGKTTLAAAVGAACGLPVLHKDALKELLYDTLGAPDRETSRAIGRAAIAVMWHLTGVELEAGHALVVEANLTRGMAEAEVASLPPHRLLELHCSARPAVLLERYAARSRHPGHHDAASLEIVREAIADGRHGPLDLDGTLVSLDTERPRADVAATAIDAVRTLTRCAPAR